MNNSINLWPILSALVDYMREKGIDTSKNIKTKELVKFIFSLYEEKPETIPAKSREEIKKVLKSNGTNALEKAVDKITKYKPMPTGTAINTIVDVINAGQDGQKGIEELPKHKAKVSHTKYTVTRGEPLNNDGDKIIIRHDISRGRGYVNIKLPDSLVKNLTGYSVATKKVFAFILEKVNEQAFNNGVLTQNYIDFSTQEVIERGIYSTYQSAVRGLKAATNALTDIKLEGEMTFGKNNTVRFSSNYMLVVLFPTAENKRGQWYVKLNDDVNWNFILQAFSILPNYYYSLPNRASELLYLIFALARQHTEDIAKRGHFSVSFRAIQQALHLPDEDKTTHPKQDIKDAINEAINEIEKTHRENFGNDEDMLFLSAEYDDTWPITQFLNEGYLHVSLSGIFAQPFVDIENDKIKGLKEAKRRQQKALEAKNKKAEKNNEK